jgi:hypothetical protein
MRFGRAALAAAGFSLAGAAPPVEAQDLPPPPRPAPDPIALDLGPSAGFAGRVGASPTFPIATRFGGVFGVGAYVWPSPRFAAGLGYEHSFLGAEAGRGDVGDVQLTRALDVLWASLRLSLYRSAGLALLVQLGPGLAFQQVDAGVVLYDKAGRPSTSTCSNGGSPGLGLRAGASVGVHVAGPVWVGADAIFDTLRLSSDPLGSCANGAGSTSVLGVRLGLTYRLDVSRWLR